LPLLTQLPLLLTQLLLQLTLLLLLNKHSEEIEKSSILMGDFFFNRKVLNIYT